MTKIGLPLMLVLGLGTSSVAGAGGTPPAVRAKAKNPLLQGKKKLYGFLMDSGEKPMSARTERQLTEYLSAMVPSKHAAATARHLLLQEQPGYVEQNPTYNRSPA